ncbi:putative aldo/keto reductase-like oxidoreductase [Anaerosolibacter carboniphilus]|uniref:Putative aldo/keto reductase-like oxidoreductase n=1 Tax=Anaerosolibacter carboniphilus TaxID=1417629 RepID=A0A841KV72_9FIRM|nr:aldo/keto reductase [Anaerosolibacter carboniphilus]MBB6214089.1 putative aldo/keto reductase-like oxidoreductase [Anaerosolibacter carboniphilus]
MKKNILGATGIEVTELCFGALPIGPLQKNVPLEEAAEVIALALEKGIGFVDTAQMYKTYPQIRRALEKTNIRPVIASKSTASSYEEMAAAIEEALEELKLNYIDIFHLHAARPGIEVFDDRKGALQCLQDYKAKGLIRAVGIATHNVEVAKFTANRNDIDILFPLLNYEGRGILGGTSEEMQKAVEQNAENGKGVYLMKVLGGGTLMNSFAHAMEFGRGVKGSSSIALGMVSKEEVLYNVGYFQGETNLEGILQIRNMKNPKVTKFNCNGCRSCIKVCHSNAITIEDDGKAHIHTDRCIQCGYCMSTCPQFSIRMV